jgi:MFS family permease
MTLISRIAHRLPFYYGWVVVAIAFVTMAIAVNARTAFSLFYPPLLEEFRWDSAQTAGAFSFGFMISAFASPITGRIADRWGPLPILQGGVLMIGLGLILASTAGSLWLIYLSLGLMIGVGSVCVGYSGQGLFLPPWFVRRRGLALSIAFAGAGAGSILILPVLQNLIDTSGWRTASLSLGIVALVVLVPLNLLVPRGPAVLGLRPDGDPDPVVGRVARKSLRIVDAEWAATDWTLARALRTARFWWLALGYSSALYAWYAVQVHQTRYLVEIGFDSTTAAWALGWVSLIGVPGQIALGWLSDRVGREIVWTTGCLGFAACYGLLILMGHHPHWGWLVLMIVAQGLLGYGITSVYGAIPVEIFEGRSYGTIYGVLMVATIGGGALGPWMTGWLRDWTGNYQAGFALAAVVSVISALSIVRASPERIRSVTGD